jgi:hypothetical protein
MYSPQFPNSDQGGNAFLVLRDPPFPDSKMNLHLIWDSLPGDFDNRDLESYIADGLQKDPRFSRTRLKDLLAVKDFAAWANESHELAVKVAYLDGQLNGLKAHAAEDHDKPIPGLPHGYLNNAEAVADHCLVLAGYRTADLLNSIFDGK